MVSGGLGRASRQHTAQIGWLGGSCVGEGPSAGRGHSFITLLCTLRLRGYTGGYKGGGGLQRVNTSESTRGGLSFELGPPGTLITCIGGMVATRVALRARTGSPNLNRKPHTIPRFNYGLTPSPPAHASCHDDTYPLPCNSPCESP